MTAVIHSAPPADTLTGRVLALITQQAGITADQIAAQLGITNATARDNCRRLRDRRFTVSVPKPTTCALTGRRIQTLCWYAAPNRTALALVPATHCTFTLGYGRRCGVRLTEVMDGLGRVSWTCSACVRRAKGLCRTCPRPLAPRRGRCGPSPVYCTPCKTARNLRLNKGRARDRTPEARQKRRESARRLYHAQKAAQLVAV